MISANNSSNPQLPDAVVQVLNIIKSLPGVSVAGAYLFGSATAGGLRPDSDLDILIAVEQSLSAAARRKLAADVMKISGCGAAAGPARPVELTVVRLADVIPWRYPPRSEFVYGEWLRKEYADGRIPSPAFDPDLAIVLTTVRNNSFAMLGPAARERFDPVPAADLYRAIHESLPALVDGLKGDERNVILTLARMWVTLSSGEIVPKDVAAGRVLKRLPPEHRAVLELARKGYLGECEDDWRGCEKELDAFVDYVRQAIDDME